MEYGWSDIEVVQQTRMEFLVFLHSVVIYHVREDEYSWECVPVEDLAIVIDLEIQALVCHLAQSLVD